MLLFIGLGLGQAGAAFLATAGNHLLAFGGRHAGPETNLALPLLVGRMICAFHVLYSSVSIKLWRGEITMYAADVKPFGII
jgi:hypothetical protein